MSRSVEQMFTALNRFTARHALSALLMESPVAGGEAPQPKPHRYQAASRAMTTHTRAFHPTESTLNQFYL